MAAVSRSGADPVDAVVRGAQDIATQYYDEQFKQLTMRADRLAGKDQKAGILPVGAILTADEPAMDGLLNQELSTMVDSMIEVYRATPGPAGTHFGTFLAQ